MFNSLEIFLGGKCNFKCKYCGLRSISLNKLSESDIKQRLSKIKNYSKFIKNFEILGGEPLIHDYLIDILNINTKLNILINTNLYRPFDLPTLNKISLNATFHHEFITIEKFCENAEKSKYDSIEIVIMANDNALEQYNFIKKRLKNINVYIESILDINTKKYDFKYKDYSKIQNIKNNNINKDQGKILSNLPKNKICPRNQLTYNFNEDKIFKCLTKMYFNDSNMDDVCDYDVCFCDVDEIRVVDEN